MTHPPSTKTGPGPGRAFWPFTLRPAHRERVLCATDGRHGWDEQGARWREPDTYAAWVASAHARNAETYCTDLGAWPHLAAASADPRCRVLYSRTRGLRGLVWRGGPRGRTTRLLAADTWGTWRPDPAGLRALRDAATAAGVGVHPSPAALGSALWATTLGDTNGGRVTPPPPACRADLCAHGVGGRVDGDGHGAREWAEAWELDMTDAYGSCIGRVPGGRVVRLTDEPTPAWATTTYRRVTVTLTRPVPLGPIHRRDPDRVRYPTTGTWTTWAWAEEVADARDAGATVTEHEGWAWTAWDDRHGAWGARMHALRQAAPGRARWAIKLATVAAIGAHGRKPGRLTVTPADRPSAPEGAVIPTDQAGTWLPLAITEAPGARDGALAHVYSYVVMTCRRRLYAKALPYARAGRLLATNYDACYVAGTPTAGGPDPDPTALGAWRARCLARLRLPRPRWVIALGIRRTPGLPRSCPVPAAAGP